MLIGKVSDTFEIKGRGLIVSTDTTVERLHKDLKLKIGDPIEIRVDGVAVLPSKVAGLEMCDPWTAQRSFGFLLRDLRKDDVPLGAEIWTIELGHREESAGLEDSTRPTAPCMQQ
jgi:hypothetical protein